MKFFVYCPSGVVTGGAELLHQFVSVLNDFGYNAFIVYYGESSRSIPSAYEKYNLHLSEEIEDAEDNVVVLYEGYFLPLSFIENAKIVLWWLSVDNFYYCQSDSISLFDLYKFNKKLFLKELVKFFLRRRNPHIFSLKDLVNDKRIVFNAYQSEYAKSFLVQHNFKNLHSLKDYINDDFFYNDKTNIKKENCIVYNPKKGYQFTKKLISKSPYLNWIPIEKMTRDQVKDLLRRAKIYVDFGYHPGKDRIPREAAMSGCCVITGKQGSAGVYEDIPIDEQKYKFAQKRRNIKEILKAISEILKNYEYVVEDFSFYRKKIASEKKEFIEDCKSLAYFFTKKIEKS